MASNRALAMASNQCCDLAAYLTSPKAITDRQRRLLGETLIFSFEGPRVSPVARTLIKDYYAGNVILRISNLQDPAQTSNLTKELQQLAKDAGHSRPLLIGVEHEGGLISSFPNSFDVTHFPSPLGLAAGHTLSTTARVGEAISSELFSVGINWIFAPVLDILTDVTEPLDTPRRFSDDVEIINNHAYAFSQGIHNNRVATCAPETLSSTIQSIYNLIDDDDDDDDDDGPQHESVRKLDEKELGPLEYLNQQKCLDSLQISSIVHEFQDPIKLRQSIRAAVQITLRERLGCRLPVALDCSALSPDSNACTKHAPLRGLLAGCDMVRLPDDNITQVASISAIYAAFASSYLEESSASAAASRVSKLKDSCTSWSAVATTRRDLTLLLPEHANLARSAYRASITALATDPSPLIGFPSASILLLLTPTVYPAVSSTSDPFEPLGRALSRSHSRIRHVPYTVSAGLTSTHMAFLSRASAMVLVLCNSSSALTEAQDEFVSDVRRVIQQRDSVSGVDQIKKIVIGAGDPRDLIGQWDGWWRVCCYDYTLMALEAVAEVVNGQRMATGRLPMKLS